MDHPQGEFPEGVPLHLKAGQCLFWDGDSIHRGVHTGGAERLTLHATW